METRTSRHASPQTPSGPSSRTLDGKETARPTLDALTSKLQGQSLHGEEASSSSRPLFGLAAEEFKRLALASKHGSESGVAATGNEKARRTSTGEEGSVSNTHIDDDGSPLPNHLSKLVLDEVQAAGGEVVFLLGHKPDTASNEDAVPTNGSSLTGRAKPTMGKAGHIDVTFSSEELGTVLDNLAGACQGVHCQATVLYRPTEAEATTSTYAMVLIRRRPVNAQELLELRIAVVGNVDAGKSSTLGVLTRGGLDDGRGKARVNLFRHKHEIESGRTSSVGMEILGFDAAGKAVMNVDPKNSADPGRKMSWEEVCEKSAKVVSFIDLAGHERYLKTTVGGLTGCLPDFVMLMVGANAGLIGMSKEHLGVALALAVPVLVCITKIDMTPPHILEATLKQLTKILRSPGCRKTPVFVETEEQAIEAAVRLGSERICPVFQISNVTGQHLSLLRSFLNILPQADASKFSPNAPFKFQLQDVFSVPFVGCVVSGVVLSGAVRIGDNLIIGPDSLGQFTNTSVRSIQRKRVNVELAVAGQSASFALKRIRRNQVRKGMVMMAKTGEGQAPPRAVMTCDAEILCLYHSTTLSVGSCMVLHAASIRQTVRIVQIAKLDAQGAIISSTWPTSAEAQATGGGAPSEQGKDNGLTALRGGQTNVDRPVVRTGDRALLRLQFIRTAEYLEPGTRLIAREARTRIIGVVRAVGETGPLTKAGPA